MSGINYTNSGASSSPAVAGADDGVSLVGGNVQLGQAVGAAGDPAKLTENREIPLNGSTVDFRHTANDAVQIAEGEIDITGDPASGTGAGGAAFNLFDFTGNFNILLNGIGILMNWNGAILQRLYTGLMQLTYGGVFVPTGLGNSIRSTSTLAESFGASDGTLVCDTTAGNMVISVSPAAISSQFGWIKKRGTDLNTITIAPTTGSIYGGNGAAASFTFQDAGESIQFQSDGVNIYVL